MGLFGHKCSKCGASCVWKETMFDYGWWCPVCAKQKSLEKRIAELERKLRR